MGIINPGRRRRKRLQSPKDEGTRRYSAARKWERTSGGSLHRSAPSPPSQKLPPGIRHLVVFAALPRTQVQGTRYLVNQRIPWCSHRLFEWLSTPKSGVFFFLLRLYKKLSNSFWASGAFSKDKQSYCCSKSPTAHFPTEIASLCSCWQERHSLLCENLAQKMVQSGPFFIFSNLIS